MLRKKIQDSINRNLDKYAIVSENEALTYGDINKKTISISDFILSKDIDESKTIGLYFDRGVDGILAMLGCLFAGITYVPIDYEETDKNIEFMINNSGIQILLTNHKGLHKIEERRNAIIEVCCIEDILLTDSNKSCIKCKENEKVYHLYTSGSTGRPKAIAQTENNILHFVSNYVNELMLSMNDKMTLFSSYSHDAFVIDVYSCLLVGATLFPIDIRNVKSILMLSNWLRKNEITVWHSVPTFFRKYFMSYGLIDEFYNLEKIVLGGEKVRPKDYEIFKKIHGNSNMALYNLYGQTESSYTSGQFVTSVEMCERMGKPIKDSTIIIKNVSEELIFIGSKLYDDLIEKIYDLYAELEEGEVCIVSKYLPGGYINENEMSKCKFKYLGNDFYLFKSGDYARIYQNHIRFIGRKDGQCKINGNRIELLEIENYLLELSSVEDCIVYCKEVNDQNKLFCILKMKNKISLIEMNHLLSRRFPKYVVFQNIVILEQFEYTVSGKVDRKKMIEKFG